MPAAGIEIDITVLHPEWPEMRSLIERAVSETLSEIKTKTGSAREISIVLANDAFVRELNKTYRGKDKPTNVLSFPQTGEDDPMAAHCLGDVIMAFETVKKEALEQNKAFLDHTIHLVVHGTLHLTGLDHENDQEAEEMEETEIKILQKLGIKNPYESMNFMQ